MMRSVSTLARSMGAATAVSATNASTSGLAVAQELAHIGEAARHRGGRRHRRAHQVRPDARTLAALEVAVRRGRDALTASTEVAVHPDAHRASGLAPLETG